MSINVLKIRDPRLQIEPDRTYSAVIGGSHVTTKSYNCDTANNSQIIWSVTTPSVRVGMDRRVEVEAVFRIKCKDAGGVNYSDLLANPAVGAWQTINNAGPRQYPLHSIIEVMNCTLNDQAFSYEPAQVLHALLQYGNTAEDRQHFMGSSPHKPDVSPDYTVSGADAGNRSPFASYFNSGYEDSRHFKYWAKSIGTNEIELKVYETLMVSPFYWGRNDHQALFGIQHFDVSLTLSNVNRILSGSGAGLFGATGLFATGVAGGLEVTIVPDLQKLHITFITPQPDQSIPSLLHFPYYQIKRYTQSVPTPVPAGTSFEVNFNNLSLHEIPKRMYLFGRPKLDNDPTKADYYAAIDRLSISFDNQDGRLSTLNDFDLYKLSAKNGLDRSFLAYRYVMGSVLCLEFGTDLNLNPLLCAGVRGNFQYAAKVNFVDIRPAGAGDVSYNVFTLMVPEGVMTIQDQLVSISIGTLTEEIIALAPFASEGFRREIQDYYGGVKFSNIWSGIKKAFNVAKPILRDVAGAVSAVAPLIPSPYAMGVGIGAKAVNKALGGRKMRTSSLAHRL